MCRLGSILNANVLSNAIFYVNPMLLCGPCGENDSMSSNRTCTMKRYLRNHFFYHFAFYVCKPEGAALKIVREFFMVKAKLV